MRRFAAEIVVFLALQGIVAALVARACPRREDHYAAATGDKRRHLESCPSPRIIFVGGSSAAFGWDSRVAAKHGLQPVNMGHNSSLGLRFMLAQVRGSMRPGDIVVVSPEIQLLWKPGVDASLVTHLEYDPASLAVLDFETGRRLLDGGLPWVAGKVRCAMHQVSTAPPIGYARDAFDATGDFASHRGKPPRPHSWTPSAWPDARALRLEDSLALLAEFSEACGRAGARCVFAFSPLRRGQFEANEATADVVERAVRERSGLQVVVSLKDALFAHDAYQDEGPHLIPDAATARTQALLRAL